MEGNFDQKMSVALVIWVCDDRGMMFCISEMEVSNNGLRSFEDWELEVIEK